MSQSLRDLNSLAWIIKNLHQRLSLMQVSPNHHDSIATLALAPVQIYGQRRRSEFFLIWSLSFLNLTCRLRNRNLWSWNMWSISLQTELNKQICFQSAGLMSLTDGPVVCRAKSFGSEPVVWIDAGEKLLPAVVWDSSWFTPSHAASSSRRSRARQEAAGLGKKNKTTKRTETSVHLKFKSFVSNQVPQ